jgi:diguanylate cyclase (GGDEF)-like protein
MKLVGFTAIRTNITDKKHIEHLSITDELTQLYNRRFFNNKIDKEINRAKRENNYLSFLILDVDYFKEYNDTYGHQARRCSSWKKLQMFLKNIQIEVVILHLD